jgi:predicted nucleic acid-binding protein
VIVLDTSVLSHVFRRPAARAAQSELVARFSSLLEDGPPLAIPGIVYQELLSGVRDDIQFARLRRALEGFPLLIADAVDHLEAARLVNALRRRGVAASSVDALIAAITIQRDAVLFTTDSDFESISRVAPLRILPV